MGTTGMERRSVDRMKKFPWNVFIRRPAAKIKGRRRVASEAGFAFDSPGKEPEDWKVIFPWYIYAMTDLERYREGRRLTSRSSYSNDCLQSDLMAQDVSQLESELGSVFGVFGREGRVEVGLSGGVLR